MSELGVREAHASAVADRDEASGHRAVEADFGHAMSGVEVVAFPYARRALIEVLRAMDVEPGREVLLSPLTCKVVPLAILAGGWQVRYVDVDESTLNLDPTRLSGALSRGAGAVLFQHTYGLPDGAEEVAVAARQGGVPIVEDCCHCVPLHRPGWSPGTVGNAALFSNNLLKPLPAGAGALATTDDPTLAERLRARREEFRPSGLLERLSLRATYAADRTLLWPSTYWWIYNAYHGARTSARLRPLEEEIAREIDPTARRLSSFEVERARAGARELPQVDAHRRRCADRYRSALSDAAPLTLPSDVPGIPLFFFPVLVPDKRALIRDAQRRRIEIVAWPNRTLISGVEDPAGLVTLGYQPGSCPVAERVASQLVGLPTHGRITDRHMERTVQFIRERYRG